jgi:hypothetical protein
MDESLIKYDLVSNKPPLEPLYIYEKLDASFWLKLTESIKGL